MKDGRLTVYFGTEDREILQAIFNKNVGEASQFRSEAEFLRYCIRYTMEHDKSLGKTK